MTQFESAEKHKTERGFFFFGGGGGVELVPFIHSNLCSMDQISSFSVVSRFEPRAGECEQFLWALDRLHSQAKETEFQMFFFNFAIPRAYPIVIATWRHLIVTGSIFTYHLMPEKKTIWTLLWSNPGRLHSKRPRYPLLPLGQISNALVFGKNASHSDLLFQGSERNSGSLWLKRNRAVDGCSQQKAWLTTLRLVKRHFIE